MPTGIRYYPHHSHQPVHKGLVEAQVRGQGGSWQGRCSPGLDLPQALPAASLTYSGPCSSGLLLPSQQEGSGLYE